MLGGEVRLHFSVIARELTILGGGVRGHAQRIDRGAFEAASQNRVQVAGFQRDARALIQFQVELPVSVLKVNRPCWTRS